MPDIPAPGPPAGCRATPPDRDTSRVETSTRRRVASNTAVQVAGKGVVLALGAGSLAVLTRYLGPDGYGRFTLALMYMQLFGVLADVSLFTTVVRDISKDPSRTEQLVGNALTLRLLLSIAMIALGTAVSCSPTSRTCAWQSCSPAGRSCSACSPARS